MKSFYFCSDEEWGRLVNCTDPRQDRRHSEEIDLSLRVKFESQLKEKLNFPVDTTGKPSINPDLISFDPEMQYYPQAYWQVSLVFFTWGYNIISRLDQFLEDFCRINNTWFSLWIDAHPIYVVLFPDSDIVFKLGSSYSGTEIDKKVAMKIATYGLGVDDDKFSEINPENWPRFFWDSSKQ